MLILSKAPEAISLAGCLTFSFRFLRDPPWPLPFSEPPHWLYGTLGSSRLLYRRGAMLLELNNVEVPKYGTKYHHPPLPYLLQPQTGRAFAIHTPPKSLAFLPWMISPVPRQRIHGSKAVVKVGWNRWLGTHSVILSELTAPCSSPERPRLSWAWQEMQLAVQ